MWTRRQYEDAAAKIGKQFVESDGAESINDLSTKVAQEAGLNPDGIRTMVCLANVTAFEGIFEKKAKEKAADRMIEFDIGEPEVVINNLFKEAQDQHQEKVAADYNRQLDYFSDIPKEKEPLEKTASAVPGVEIEAPKEREYSPHEVKYAFERAAKQMSEAAEQTKFRWLDLLEKTARCLVARDSSTAYRTQFEKNAVSLLGEEVAGELLVVRKLTSPTNTPAILFDGEKIASVVNSHIANVVPEEKTIIDMVKAAHDARCEVERYEAGIQWIAANIPGGN